MMAARKDLGLTQAQLGDRLVPTTSQAMISDIESGKVTTSKFILPICRVLKIAEPRFYTDEDQRVWSQLGHLMRNRNPKKYQRYVALLEADLEEEAASDTEPATPLTRK